MSGVVGNGYFGGTDFPESWAVGGIAGYGLSYSSLSTGYALITGAIANVTADGNTCPYFKAGDRPTDGHIRGPTERSVALSSFRGGLSRTITLATVTKSNSPAQPTPITRKAVVRKAGKGIGGQGGVTPTTRY